MKYSVRIQSCDDFLLLKNEMKSQSQDIGQGG